MIPRQVLANEPLTAAQLTEGWVIELSGRFVDQLCKRKWCLVVQSDTVHNLSRLHLRDI